METRAARAASSSRAQRALDVRTCKLTVYGRGGCWLVHTAHVQSRVRATKITCSGAQSRPRDPEHFPRAPRTLTEVHCGGRSTRHTASACRSPTGELCVPISDGRAQRAPISDGRAQRADLRRARNAAASSTVAPRTSAPTSTARRSFGVRSGGGSRSERRARCGEGSVELEAHSGWRFSAPLVTTASGGLPVAIAFFRGTTLCTLATAAAVPASALLVLAVCFARAAFSASSSAMRAAAALSAARCSAVGSRAAAEESLALARARASDDFVPDEGANQHAMREAIRRAFGPRTSSYSSSHSSSATWPSRPQRRPPQRQSGRRPSPGERRAERIV